MRDGQRRALNVFRNQPGFEAYGVAKARDGKVVSMSVWNTGEQAEQANQPASWVRENIADRLRLEESRVGDFLFYETA